MANRLAAISQKVVTQQPKLNLKNNEQTQGETSPKLRHRVRQHRTTSEQRIETVSNKLRGGGGGGGGLPLVLQFQPHPQLLTWYKH